VTFIVSLVNPSASPFNFFRFDDILFGQSTARLFCYADAIVDTDYEVLLPARQNCRLGLFHFRIANSRQIEPNPGFPLNRGLDAFERFLEANSSVFQDHIVDLVDFKADAEEIVLAFAQEEIDLGKAISAEWEQTHRLKLSHDVFDHVCVLSAATERTEKLALLRPLLLHLHEFDVFSWLACLGIRHARDFKHANLNIVIGRDSLPFQLDITLDIQSSLDFAVYRS